MAACDDYNGPYIYIYIYMLWDYQIKLYSNAMYVKISCIYHELCMHVLGQLTSEKASHETYLF